MAEYKDRQIEAITEYIKMRDEVARPFFGDG